MSVPLIDRFVSTEALSDVFCDGAFLASMLQFEAALARAEARAGVIPAAAAEVIAAAALPEAFDVSAIARAAGSAATLTVPLVDMLRTHVAAVDRDAATYVHWGATSQDVGDTALVLCLNRARTILAADHARLQRALRHLSDAHAETIMLARTLLQPATPITFGLKAASWLSAISRSGTQLLVNLDAAAVLQFGGASGTLAVLGERRAAVCAELARELDLVEPDAPWHASRERLAAVVAGCGVYCGTLAKVARDVTLLMQDEVGEVSEPGGGSSAMPHKRNPAGCAAAIAAATRVPGYVATFLTGMAQEHERGVGGWIADVSTIAAAVQATGAALAALADVVSTLNVDDDRMRDNVMHRDVVLAERALALLAPVAGRDRAAQLIDEAIRTARTEARRFTDVLASLADVRAALTSEQLAALSSLDPYVAAADHFRRRQLASLEGPRAKS